MKKKLKGKILRVKRGYNPNSSSMGSIVFALPTALLGVAAGFGVVSGIILSAFMKDKKKSSMQKVNASAETSKSKEPSDIQGK